MIYNDNKSLHNGLADFLNKIINVGVYVLKRINNF